jgi:hypothetical protein
MTDTHTPEAKRKGRPPKAKEEHDETLGLSPEPTDSIPPEEDSAGEPLPPDAEAAEDEAAATDDEAVRGSETALSDDGDALANGDEPALPEAGEPLDLADGWSAMDTAPVGGKPCYVAGLIGPGIPLVVGAYLHHSRRYMGSQFRYVPYTEWRIIDTPFRVPFDPMCWARYQ